ncbi:histidinol-phosphatase [Patulibacter minatonensis]|uniref:histidinol-phosphatase n=1 Tax=Patulibacter minatonensis TaxID=298163 RepID=UPI00047884E4|nr:histidinol-phosphatase [Patulibacter minatonensis]
MLSDLHVHLRPDAHPSEPDQYFTGKNGEAYRAAATARGITELGASEHIHRFEQALDVWQHPFWKFSARDDLDAYCAFVREETDLKLGIEADFIPGREDRMAELLGARDWDYVIGSVHFLADRGVDAEYSETGTNWDVWDGARSADDVWRKYFETLAECARSGLYDILAHPDLVKVWGRNRPAPEIDPRYFYEPAIEAIAESGIVVEISTAGLRKPAGELYPATAFLEMVADAGNAVALSSDAHTTEHLGYGYAEALEALDAVGITELTTFERRTPRAIPIEDADRETAHRHGNTPPPAIDPETGRPG